MAGGAPRWDRFAHWPRGAARAALAAAVIVLVAAVWTARPAEPAIDHTTQGATAQPAERDTDLQLYDRIVERVTAGDSYYTAAIEEQRARSFPVRPAVAVRPPTLAYLAALMGSEALAALILLGALAAGAWYLRVGDEPGGPDRKTIAAALLVFGMASGLNPAYPLLHEVWAGLLVALSIGLYRPGRWHLAWLAAAAALAIREHALPFVLLLGALAAARRDWKETAAWAVLVVLFGAGLWFHIAQVNALLLPSDRPSDGWLALRGLRGLTGNIVTSSPLQFLPFQLAAPLALLPLLGWAGWRSPLGTFAMLLCAGYGLLFMIAGRDNNFYWALVVTPVWFVGLAFLPMALRSLWRRAVGG